MTAEINNEVKKQFYDRLEDLIVVEGNTGTYICDKKLIKDSEKVVKKLLKYTPEKCEVLANKIRKKSVAKMNIFPFIYSKTSINNRNEKADYLDKLGQLYENEVNLGLEHRVYTYALKKTGISPESLKKGIDKAYELFNGCLITFYETKHFAFVNVGDYSDEVLSVE